MVVPIIGRDLRVGREYVQRAVMTVNIGKHGELIIGICFPMINSCIYEMFSILEFKNLPAM